MGVFIGNLIRENDDKYLVSYIKRHYDNLPQEILNNGVVVNDLPRVEFIAGKTAVGPYYNPKTGELWYEYVDNQLSDLPTPEERIEQLETVLMETTVLLSQEQQKNAQNEQAIMELSVLVSGGIA